LAPFCPGRRLRELGYLWSGDDMADFAETIATAYAVDAAALDLGRGVHDGAVAPAAVVQLPLRMVNRHGLIAGATGTGKTTTLQASPSSCPRPACRSSWPTSRVICPAWPSPARRAAKKL